MPNISTVLGDTVRDMMAARGLRQVDVAAHLGIPQSSVSARLNGHTDWTVTELIELADLLGVHPAALLDAA